MQFLREIREKEDKEHSREHSWESEEKNDREEDSDGEYPFPELEDNEDEEVEEEEEEEEVAACSHVKPICDRENKVSDKLWVSKSPAKERSSTRVRNIPRKFSDKEDSVASNVRNAPETKKVENKIRIRILKQIQEKITKNEK